MNHDNGGEGPWHPSAQRVALPLPVVDAAPEKPPLPPVIATPAGLVAPPQSRAQLGARLCWAAFWAVLAFPFLKNAAFSLTGSWETISNAPGDILGGGLQDIASLSPYFGLGLLALALGFIVCRVKSRPAAGGAILRARLLLLLVAAVGAVVSVRQIAFIADDVFRRGGVEIPSDDYAFRQTVLGAMLNAPLSDDFDAIVQQAIDNNDIERARIYLNAGDILRRPVTAATRQKYEDETTWWKTAWRAGTSCASGALLRNAETLTQLVCILGFDLTTGVGDELDILRQGYNYAVGDDVDQVILALAGIGVAINLFSGSDADLKEAEPGIVIAKDVMRATRNLKELKASERIDTELRQLAGQAIDIGMLGRRGLAGAKQAFKPEGMRQIRYVFDNLNDMRKASGSMATPFLALKYSDRLTELDYFGRVAKVFGKNADSVIDVVKRGWKRAFWRAGKAVAKDTVKLTAWYTGLAAAVTAFLIAISTSASTWLMKRIILFWARRKAITPV